MRNAERPASSLARSGRGEIELPVSTTGAFCAIDCSRVGPITPALLHQLATVHERSAAAGLPVRLLEASPALEAVFGIIAPPQARALIDVTAGLLPATAAGIAASISSIQAHCRRQQVPELTAYVMRTLFEEVTTNFRLHAGLPEDAELFWQLHLMPHRSAFVFADSGTPFDLTRWDPETGPVERTLGDDRPPFGIRLIRSLAQRVEYRRIEDELNLLILERDGREHP